MTKASSSQKACVLAVAWAVCALSTEPKRRGLDRPAASRPRPPAPRALLELLLRLQHRRPRLAAHAAWRCYFLTSECFDFKLKRKFTVDFSQFGFPA